MLGRGHSVNEGSVKGWGEPGMYREGQGSMQWSRESGMRWGEGRKQGLDHDTVRHLFISQKQHRVTESFESGDMLSERRKKILCCTHKGPLNKWPLVQAYLARSSYNSP